MTFTLLLSRTTQKALDKLPPNTLKKLYPHLEEIARDPYRPRPKADIAPVAGSGTLYRLRVGKLRVEYEVNEGDKTIKIARIFLKKRKSDYR
jgi:mRNA-degrading endonuclease RelE of RelBE toxin-antitoxin system